ncbi:MAG: T9SS type A sorting domain-containing protein [Ignavibacteria bacterium]|nr:T9SS type A sorting domain-containing protein [Ignavibacteria bacterium]
MNRIISISLIMILLIGVKAFSQDNKKFQGPHDFYPENARIKTSPDAGTGNYAFLPAPYPNVNISNDPFPQNEPSVKFNAKYPNRVLAAWRDFRTGVEPPLRRIGYSYSTDGGTTWSVSQLIPALSPNHPLASDPVVVSDTNGTFYVATVSLTTSGSLDLVVYKSTDLGVTFTDYNFVSGGLGNSEDKEWMICDLTKGSSPYKNHLYITWTRFGTPSGILCTKSVNGGLNWSAPVQVSNGGGVQGSDPAIGPNGEVYAVWVGGTSSTDIIYFDKSTNGGVAFGTDKIIAQGPAPVIPITSSQITFPSIDCDISGGPRNGYVYTVWCDARNGDPDIFFIRSTNGGTNWSDPLRVNNDSSGNGKLQCWPWISVNEQGNIAVLYYDARNGTSNTNIEAWLARSTDGGQTFVNEKLSSVNFTAAWPNTDVRFGDYINIDYSGNRIATVWTDLRAGGSTNQEIYTAVVDLSVGIKKISETAPADYELEQNYPNPFNPSTTINFSVPKNDYVKIKVFDISGKEAATVVSGYYNAGKYSAEFNGSKLTSGVYFYRLEVNGFSETKRMLLIK